MGVEFLSYCLVCLVILAPGTNGGLEFVFIMIIIMSHCKRRLQRLMENLALSLVDNLFKL